MIINESSTELINLMKIYFNNYYIKLIIKLNILTSFNRVQANRSW